MNTELQLTIFAIVVLILSAAVHEYLHAWTADQLGDSTARDLGRLTPNPIAHIDPVGSILLPFLLIVSGTPFVFGYAKPVPINYARLGGYNAAKVALAGPLANFAIALAFGFVLRFVPFADPRLAQFLQYIVLINLLLFIFNLIPIPPLDGSRLLLPLLPYRLQERFLQFEVFGFVVVILFILLASPVLWLLVSFAYRLIVGG